MDVDDRWKNVDVEILEEVLLFTDVYNFIKASNLFRNYLRFRSAYDFIAITRQRLPHQLLNLLRRAF